jgi:hypothetical protein
MTNIFFKSTKQTKHGILYEDGGSGGGGVGGGGGDDDNDDHHHHHHFCSNYELIMDTYCK